MYIHKVMKKKIDNLIARSSAERDLTISTTKQKYVYEMSPVTTWLLSSAAARSYPVSIPGRYGRYGYPGSYPEDRIRIRIRSRNKLKLHLPEGYGMSATSTTDLEPLSDHGAAARVRHLREHLPLDPLNSRRSLSGKLGRS